MSINERIKEVRGRIGLTQSKFAERIAISTSYLGEIELSTKVANERVIRLVVAEFNVNDHWLRSGEGEMFSPDVDTQAIKVLSLFKSLDQKFKSYALDQLEGLSDLHSLIKQEKGLS